MKKVRNSVREWVESSRWPVLISYVSSDATVEVMGSSYLSNAIAIKVLTEALTETP